MLRVDVPLHRVHLGHHPVTCVTAFRPIQTWFRDPYSPPIHTKALSLSSPGMIRAQFGPATQIGSLLWMKEGNFAGVSPFYVFTKTVLRELYGYSCCGNIGLCVRPPCYSTWNIQGIQRQLLWDVPWARLMGGIRVELLWASRLIQGRFQVWRPLRYAVSWLSSSRPAMAVICGWQFVSILGSYAFTPIQPLVTRSCSLCLKGKSGWHANYDALWPKVWTKLHLESLWWCKKREAAVWWKVIVSIVNE